VYFSKELGATNEFIGLLSAVAALFELPPMFLIDRLLRRINPYFALLAGMIGMMGLMLVYTFVQNPLLLLPLMMIRGTIFTLMSIGIVMLITQISNPVNIGTNQALAQVTLVSVASALTAFLSGAIFDLMGGRLLFRVAALLAFLGIGILIITYRQVMQPYKPQMPMLENETALNPLPD
jgi:MFS family permease